jgi:restriction system protein
LLLRHTLSAVLETRLLAKFRLIFPPILHEWWQMDLLSGIALSVVFVIGLLMILLVIMHLSKESKNKEVSKNKAFRMAVEGMEAATLEVTDAHMPTLLRKFHQLVRKDDYGNYLFDSWNRETLYFVENVVKPAAKVAGQWDTSVWDDQLRIEFCSEIVSDRVIDAVTQRGKVSVRDVHSGEDFELLCKSILESAGWDVRRTPSTGDQGADLIAEKANRTVVVQCKYYSSPVGNKAVQEAYAGKAHQGSDAAVVVSNAAYTKSAQELAHVTGVILLHHEDLPNIDHYLR